ncbi:unnamed protein product, partial [Closterium sp. NIES-64]
MDAGFLEALVKAGSMILVSEIGDKTFFVAALLAMRQPRRWVLLGSLSALWLMTILSSLFGWAAPNLLPRSWTHVSTTLLFFLFGLRSLWDGLTMDAARASEELKEVEQELPLPCHSYYHSPSLPLRVHLPTSGLFLLAPQPLLPTPSLPGPSSLQSNGVNGGGHEGSMNGVGGQGEEESKHGKAQRLAWHRFFSPAFLQVTTLSHNTLPPLSHFPVDCLLSGVSRGVGRQEPAGNNRPSIRGQRVGRRARRVHRPCGVLGSSSDGGAASGLSDIRAH